MIFNLNFGGVYMKINVRLLAKSIITISCFISIIVILVVGNEEIYKSLVVFPMLFWILYIFIYDKIIFKIRGPFSTAYIIIMFVRYVIMVTLINLYGNIAISKVVRSNASIKIAIYLYLMEIILSTLMLTRYYYKNTNNIMNKKINTFKFDLKSRRKIVFVIYAIIVLLLVAIFPNSLKNIYFISPEKGIGDEMTDIEEMVVMMLEILKNLIFIGCVRKLYSIYSKSKSNIYVMLSIILAICNSLIYTGTNRINFLIRINDKYIYYSKIISKI